ncbi:hypothetical protein FOB63_003603 [Clavispora lusitaniae]|uniref:Uncharacterized protein n=1 Tax=Clavispora lusitaniae (strain ATCC 42720) TaxID=306902 RepID=C4Y7K8_CLAL4|nr:uncharacterized protein CLUG_04186 [Clavispora lusitaniae ATCC 42720]EEQ40058.1 predicted protein [Clavispora lusitaniae ATCC 42720]KAF7581981.1 hypothetical protein FOB63_003603 [Clavispora lusitaniae]
MLHLIIPVNQVSIKENINPWENLNQFAYFPSLKEVSSPSFGPEKENLFSDFSICASLTETETTGKDRFVIVGSRRYGKAQSLNRANDCHQKAVSSGKFSRIATTTNVFSEIGFGHNQDDQISLVTGQEGTPTVFSDKKPSFLVCKPFQKHFNETWNTVISTLILLLHGLPPAHFSSPSVEPVLEGLRWTSSLALNLGAYLQNNSEAIFNVLVFLFFLPLIVLRRNAFENEKALSNRSNIYLLKTRARSPIIVRSAQPKDKRLSFCQMKKRSPRNITLYPSHFLMDRDRRIRSILLQE